MCADILWDISSTSSTSFQEFSTILSPAKSSQVSRLSQDPSKPVRNYYNKRGMLFVYLFCLLFTEGGGGVFSLILAHLLVPVLREWCETQRYERGVHHAQDLTGVSGWKFNELYRLINVSFIVAIRKDAYFSFLYWTVPWRPCSTMVSFYFLTCFNKIFKNLNLTEV